MFDSSKRAKLSMIIAPVPRDKRPRSYPLAVPARHLRADGDPESLAEANYWVPACAGMTESLLATLLPQW